MGIVPYGFTTSSREVRRGGYHPPALKQSLRLALARHLPLHKGGTPLTRLQIPIRLWCEVVGTDVPICPRRHRRRQRAVGDARPYGCYPTLCGGVGANCVRPRRDDVGIVPYGVYPRLVRGKGFPSRGSWLPEGQTDGVVAERRIFNDNPKAFGNTSSASFHSAPSPQGEGLILPPPWCGVVGRKEKTARQRTVGRFY